jgi:outer membrane protein assembly factor BamB
MNLISLYAFDVETGENKWSFFPEAVVAGYNPPTVNPVKGDIYFGTNAKKGNFYAVKPDGTLKWTFGPIAGSMQSTAPAVSADGNVVYIIDNAGTAFALDAETGTEKWSVNLGTGIGADLLVNGTDLVVALKQKEDGLVFLNAADGTVIAKHTLESKSGATHLSSFAVVADKKTAYLSLAGGNNNPVGSGMAKIDLVNRTIIKSALFANNDCYAPAVASNGYIVAGSKDGLVYCLDSELEVKWTFNHLGNAEPQANSLNFACICTNSEGKAIVTCGASKAGHMVYVLDVTSGTSVQNFQYNDSPNGYAMCGGMFHDGFYYYGTAAVDNTGGDFFGRYVGGDYTFWGVPGGDICGSNCLQSPLHK